MSANVEINVLKNNNNDKKIIFEIIEWHTYFILDRYYYI